MHTIAYHHTIPFCYLQDSQDLVSWLDHSYLDQIPSNHSSPLKKTLNSDAIMIIYISSLAVTDNQILTHDAIFWLNYFWALQPSLPWTLHNIIIVFIIVVLNIDDKNIHLYSKFKKHRGLSKAKGFGFGMWSKFIKQTVQEWLVIIALSIPETCMYLHVSKYLDVHSSVNGRPMITTLVADTWLLTLYFVSIGQISWWHKVGIEHQWFELLMYSHRIYVEALHRNPQWKSHELSYIS